MQYTMTKHGLVLLASDKDPGVDRYRDLLNQQASDLAAVVDGTTLAARQIEGERLADRKVKADRIGKTFDRARDEVRRITDIHQRRLTLEDARASRGSGEMPADTPVQVRSVIDHNQQRAERVLADASAFSRTRAVRGW